MLKLGLLPLVTQKIELRLNFGGEVQEQDFTVTFRVLPLSRGTEDTISTHQAQRQLLEEAIVGLDGIVDDDDKPVPYDAELFAALVDRLDIRAGLLRAYFEARAEAARGN